MIMLLFAFLVLSLLPYIIYTQILHVRRVYVTYVYIYIYIQRERGRERERSGGPPYTLSNE